MLPQWLLKLLTFRRVNVNINVTVPLPAPPRRPKPFRGSLGKGNSVMAVKYKYTVSPASDTDVVKALVKVTVEGFKQYTIDVPFPQPGPTPATDIVVPDNCNFHVADSDVDKAGNESDDSPAIIVTGAKDTTPPGQPGGGGLGKGQSVDDSELPPMEAVS